jgi:hypothetical protein
MTHFSLSIYVKPGLKTDIFVDPPSAINDLVPYLEAKIKTWNNATKQYDYSVESVACHFDPLLGHIVLPRGLVKWFVRSLHEDGYIQNENLQIFDSVQDEFNPFKFDFTPYFTLFDIEKQKSIELRYYQKDGVKAALSDKIGIVSHPTGTGKGEEIVTLSRILSNFGPVLVLCPSSASMESTIQRFNMYDVPCCEYLKVRNKEEIDCTVIGTPGAIYNDLQNGRENFLKQIIYVISNEAHHSQGNQWYEVVIGLPNVIRSIGFTATSGIIGKLPIHESFKFETMIRGSHGEIVHEKSSLELAEFVSAPKNLCLVYKPPKIPKNHMFEFDWRINKHYLNRQDRLHFVSEIAHIIDRHSEFTSITFVSEKTDQGDRLYDWYPYLTAAWYGGGVVKNKCDLDLDRKSIFNAIMKKDIRHTIVTSHAREDINLPILNFAIVFELKKLGPIKQACGRVTRPDSPSFFVNVSDTAPGLLALQAEQRSEIIRQEYGRTPIVIKTLEDFKLFVCAAAEAYA